MQEEAQNKFWKCVRKNLKHIFNWYRFDSWCCANRRTSQTGPKVQKKFDWGPSAGSRGKQTSVKEQFQALDRYVRIELSFSADKPRLRSDIKAIANICCEYSGRVVPNLPKSRATLSQFGVDTGWSLRWSSRSWQNPTKFLELNYKLKRFDDPNFFILFNTHGSQLSSSSLVFSLYFSVDQILIFLSIHAL